MSCAECEYARAEELARGRSCLRCWSPEMEPYWYGRTVLVIPDGCTAEAQEPAGSPAWCKRRV